MRGVPPDEARARRLEDLARRVAAGRYRIPVLLVADAIVARHRGQRPGNSEQTCER